MDFIVKDGVLINYKGSGGEVIIPNTITHIGKYAFNSDYGKKVTSVILPDSIVAIRECAFSWCSFASIVFSKRLVCIEPYSFFGCEKLTSVTIPENVDKINTNTFSQCSNLTSVIISGSHTEISPFAFQECPKDAMITYRGFTFPLSGVSQLEKVLDIVENHNLSVKMKSDMKNAVVLSAFKHTQTDKEINAYIGKNIFRIFRVIIENNDIEAVMTIVKTEEILNQHNIDKFIRYAIDSKRTEIQVLLTNYKMKYIEFSSPAERLFL